MIHCIELHSDKYCGCSTLNVISSSEQVNKRVCKCARYSERTTIVLPWKTSYLKETLSNRQTLNNPAINKLIVIFCDFVRKIKNEIVHFNRYLDRKGRFRINCQRYMFTWFWRHFSIKTILLFKHFRIVKCSICSLKNVSLNR